MLVVDDDPQVLAALVDFFSDNYEVLAADTGARALELARHHPDIAVAVIDIKMAPMNGIDTARELRNILDTIQIIFHTGYPGEFNEAEIDRTEDPFDYIEKGRSLNELSRAVRRALESWQLRNGNLRRRAAEDLEMIGSSKKMQEVYSLIYRLARSDAKVMIFGETGTGKEKVAQALHKNSPRRTGQFGIVPVVGESMDQLCATLFGARAGAYTGLTYDRTGLVEYASDGVVFVDEVGEIPMDVQTKLLRVLDRGEYQRHGESEMRKSNARFICATHRDLEKLVAERKFREDLYYRLKGIPIHLPPLRERKEDIPELTEYFVAKFTVEKGHPVKYLDPAVYDVLLEYDWPGNVRELERIIDSVTAVTDCEIIVAADVHKVLNGDLQRSDISRRSLKAQLEECERTAIIQALVQTGGEVTSAAQRLGLDRTHLHRKIKQHNIELTGLRGEA